MQIWKDDIRQKDTVSMLITKVFQIQELFSKDTYLNVLKNFETRKKNHTK